MTTKRRYLSRIAAVGLLAASLLSAGCEPRTTLSAPAGIPAPIASTTPRSDAAVPSSAITTPPATTASGASAPVNFAIIGDFGGRSWGTRAVARMVQARNPEFIITTGDNYYEEAGGRGLDRYDRSVGEYYSTWLHGTPAFGQTHPPGAPTVNNFFPSPGNHDYQDPGRGITDYLTYFELPGAGFTSSSGNERFYDYVRGPIHFFVLDSNKDGRDGLTADSLQARWLQQRLAMSTSPWNIVYFHHSPYSSDTFHGSTPRMRWPFAAWGADVVISGHSHTYERVMRDGIVYFVNGLGGGERRNLGPPIEGSAVRYNAGWGAQFATATDKSLDFEFYDASGVLIDSWRISAGQTPVQ